jgi:hypothetical protein
MAAFGSAVGVLLLFGLTPSLGLFRGGFLYVLHLVAAFALITQAASIATSFDMWEEREFEHESPMGAPGPRPSPTLPSAQAQ